MYEPGVLNTVIWPWPSTSKLTFDLQVFNLLELDERSASGMNDPVVGARILGAVINSRDDDGLLEDKWEAPYDDG